MFTCQCGCGRPAPISDRNHTRYGWIKGQPKRFILGHGSRGRQLSPEAKKKLSLFFSGRVITPEHRRKIGDAVAKSFEHRDYSGDKNPNWRGGKIKNYSGYILVYNPEHPRCDPNGYVFEHRLVMESKLGRILNSHEVVHHNNGNKTDNRIKNLVLFKNNGEHRSYHMSS